MARTIDPRQRRIHRALYAAITVAILGGIAWMVSIQAQSLDGTIGVEELAKGLGQDPYNIVVIDTRSPDAWRAGHVPFAVNLPLEQMGRRLGELASAQDRQVAVIDEDPERVKRALTILSQAGFRSLVTASGGMSAWRASGKKLETANDSPIHPLVE